MEIIDINTAKWIKNKDLQGITVFDVGANIGEYADIVDKYFPLADIHCFEPKKENYSKINQKYTLIKSAVTDNYEKQGLFYYNTSGEELTCGLYKRDLSYANQTHGDMVTTVPLIRLDEYIAENDIDEVGLLKIDVEGAEMNVLKSCGDFLRPDFIKIIEFEFSACQIDSRNFFRDFYDLLVGRGYKMYDLQRNGVERPIRKYSLEYENFAASREIIARG